MIEALKERYTRLFGAHSTPSNNLDTLEAQLGIVLPDDFKTIAGFFSGGIVGGIALHSTTCGAPYDYILDETTEIRKAIGLPHDFQILAEPAERLIAMEVRTDSVGDSRVIWLDATDAELLHDVASLHSPDIWNSYPEFLAWLLDEEEDERQQTQSDQV